MKELITLFRDILEMLKKRQARCREITGPTPHLVALREKPRSAKPVDYQMQERLREEAARTNVQEFVKEQQNCGIRNLWLTTSDGQFQRQAIERQIQECLKKQRSQTEERRKRLHALLRGEEEQLLQEMEGRQKEATAERQAWMREQVKALRGKREEERKQILAEKTEQLFRQRCEELQVAESRRREQELHVEQRALVKMRQELLRAERREDRLFHQMWEADVRAKEEREAERVQGQRQRDMEQLDALMRQMEAAQQQRQRLKDLKEENGSLRRQQLEMEQLQQRREKQQKLKDQQARKQELDRCLRLKMKRLAREQEEELQVDLSTLKQVLTQHTDEKLEAAQRKAELAEDQQRYLKYFTDQLEKRKQEEEEIDLLMEEALKEVWAQRDQQRQAEREARNRLMQEVMETRSLQIQHKLSLNMEKQEELIREKDELNKLMAEMKLEDENKERCRRQLSAMYQAELHTQMEQQKQRRCEDRAQAEKERRQRQAKEELYKQRTDELLSRPGWKTGHNRHPFRQAEGSSVSEVNFSGQQNY